MKNPQTVSEWLNYMGSIHVSAIDMGLDRVIPVAKQMGILTKNLTNCPTIFTVAGTNGKGSTTALISEICTQAGFKTALYQSPHLVSFNERIKINDIEVDDDMLIKAFIECEKARTQCNVSLSFFEMTTLSAFWIFKQLQCDVWVLEIGLGGRLDVVNIIDPNVCVITNIGIDHIDWLGDDREKIGFEKAGIIRENSPLIFGEIDMPHSVQQIIQEKNAHYHQFGKDFIYADNGNDWVYSSPALTIHLPKPKIALINASNAISAILASNLNVSTNHIKNALSTVQLAGRFDKRMINGKQWIFDVGHNTHGIAFLMQSFIPFWQNFKHNHSNAKLHFLFSMLADKDIDEVLSFIATFDLPITAWHIGKIDNARAIDTFELNAKISHHLPHSTIFIHNDIKGAVQSVQNATHSDDLILCFGSFHTIGESMIALGLADDPTKK
ncbi:bifunctional folylpolyglutamate synthase/dihydrofolate synthase [Moraxella oblonga]|uniref:bifunctional folylpolyglutamate synthase/dihydrofolate synthase n=1 Tax=Moraxella oblonga TaxID=200413 RepID=UPI000833EAB6|nr:folylpolyglutamate synthase/dihydrofolate synthase family protein [Moraxella oblonga]